MQVYSKIFDDERFEGVIYLEEFNSAFIGFTDSKDGDRLSAVYDRDKCIDILINNNEDSSPGDAVDWFAFNVEGQYLGDQSPVFLTLKESLILE